MQSLTELKLALVKLSNAQAELAGLQDLVESCVQFINSLTAGVPMPVPARRGRPISKPNGNAGKAISVEAFKNQVRTVYHRQRRSSTAPRKGHPKHALSLDAALDAARKKHRGVPEPSPDTLTTQEVATRLRMSDAGVRNLVSDGRLPEPRMELRRFGAHHAFRPTVVHKLADIEAYSVNRIGQAPPPRGRHVAKRPRAAKAQSVSNITQQRQLSLDHLALYDRHEPRVIGGFSGIGPLVRRGYLQKKKGGYVRTAKEFILQLKKKQYRRSAPAGGASPRVKRATYNKASVQAKRETTLALLAQYDPTEPRPVSLADNHRKIGVMVQHGYLRPKDGGYVRTQKEFHP